MKPETFPIKINILSDVLSKKHRALETILTITENQENLLTQPASPEGTAFFRAMSSEKQKLIESVQECDSVFSEVFDEIKQGFDENAHKHRDEVITLQTWIKEVMDLDIKIRFQEGQNKELLAKRKTAVITDRQKENLFEEYKKFNQP